MGRANTGNHTLLSPACVSAAQGLEQFRREHGRYPDLVVLHSNYWDIAQVVLFRWWEGWEPEYTQLMLDWLARAEKVATYLEVRAAVEAPVFCPLLQEQICSAGTRHVMVHSM